MSEPGTTPALAAQIEQIRKDRRAELARKNLRAWRRMYEQRDARIMLAQDLGLGVNEITRLTGLAKTTVLRILEPRT